MENKKNVVKTLPLNYFCFKVLIVIYVHVLSITNGNVLFRISTVQNADVVLELL